MMCVEVFKGEKREGCGGIPKSPIGIFQGHEPLRMGCRGINSFTEEGCGYGVVELDSDM